jgi:mannose-6-phosphate isomerase-like protein (cupin superfamily)
MKLTRIKSHPAFRLEGRSKHFQSFWELELTPGEETSNHQHYESEEIIYLVSGEGRIQVAESEHRVASGEVVLVPPRTNHIIANRSDRLLRAITVESRFDLGEESEVGYLADIADAQATVQATEAAKRVSRTIDGLIEELPTDVDEAVAIQTIVELFDIGGQLSEQIEKGVGLDNAEGVRALTEIERKIMLAVVRIAARYQTRGRGWLFG